MNAYLWRVTAALLVVAAGAAERTERFDTDPGWDGDNHRSTHWGPRTLVQDFGFSPSRHAGGAAAGEIGGTITPAAEPAWYAKPIAELSLDDELTASGTVACDGGPFHVLIGFFNSQTVNEWRTANSVAIRLLGRGEHFYAYTEYATRLWRAGGTPPHGSFRAGTGEFDNTEFAVGLAPHTWSFHYDPAAHDGRGGLSATIDGQTIECTLDEGHRADGARFDRFGIMTVLKSADHPGEVWLDDLVINGVAESFDADPEWEGYRNRLTYETGNIRPRFDFGFSPTNLAGGAAAGELGGQIFRGDCREPARMAHYGDRVGPLDLDQPLRAGGRFAMLRGVSDSTTILGFYNREQSMRVNPAQDSAWPACFLGFALEGPSSEGFYAYPGFRGLAGGGTIGFHRGCPRVYPNGESREWSLVYDPAGDGTVTLTVDGESTRMELAPGDKEGVTFDRFGLLTTWIDGNGQTVYFDDLTYTVSQ